MKTYLDIDELAELIGKSPRTIKQKLSSDPTSVPPKMHIPGSAMLRWRKHEVDVWLAETGSERLPGRRRVNPEMSSKKSINV